MSMYKKDFLINDENFFDKYNEIWEKVSNIIKKKKKNNNNNREVIYKKILKAVKINTKEGSHSICKQVILIKFIKKIEYYYLKVFLEKYYFDKDIEIYSNNSYYVESDEKYYDKKCIDLFLETIRKI